jgi:hypothetical protein
MRIWLMKMTMQLVFLMCGGELAQGLAHQAGLQTGQGITHLAFELRLRRERSDGVDHDQVHRTGAHQRIHDFQRLFAGVGLGDQQLLQAHAQLLRVLSIQRMLGIDEGTHAGQLLHLGDDLQRQAWSCPRTPDRRSRPRGRAAVSVDIPREMARLLRADEVDTIYYQVLDTRGAFVSGDRELPLPPDGDIIVPGELKLRDDEHGGDSVRVAYQWVQIGIQDRPALVQVAETLGKRSQLATEIIKGVILPQFVILPLAVLLVWFALARGMAPPIGAVAAAHPQA